MGEELPQEFGEYTLHELIGRGGMAEIYRATMPGIGGFEKTVAIKKILPHLAEDDEFTSMLIDEARIIESLDHSNIAQVFDLGKREGTYYIAMEYIHGVDLSEMIDELKRRGDTFPIPHVIHITASICAGLHFAHSKTDDQGNPLNVIHRDISPHNIRMSFAGEVKIIDFGVAKAKDREAHTKMGVIKGKLLYMAPEQAKAETLDGRADLFATGLCAYKMLTGTLPFDGDNEFQIYNNILQKEIAPPKQLRPDIPDELNRIVMKLLRRDPDRRYQNGYEVKQDLEQLLHQVAPGYTVNRLARFVEDNFSHLVQTDAKAATTEASRPSDLAPATPSRPAPGTGQRGTSELEGAGADSAPDSSPVRENVAADAAEGRTEPARPEGLPAQEESSEPGPLPPDRKTETAEGETGQYDSDREQEEGIPAVVYAIGAVVLAISGMIVWALVTRTGPDASATSKPAPTRPDESTQAGGSEPPTMVSVSLESKPSGARLVRKGQKVGETPSVFDLPESDKPIEVTVSKPGYRDKTVELVPNDDLDRTIQLVAADAGMEADAGEDAGGASGAVASGSHDEPDERAAVGGSGGGRASDDESDSAGAARGASGGSEPESDESGESGSEEEPSEPETSSESSEAEPSAGGSSSGPDESGDDEKAQDEGDDEKGDDEKGDDEKGSGEIMDPF